MSCYTVLSHKSRGWSIRTLRQPPLTGSTASFFLFFFDSPSLWILARSLFLFSFPSSSSSPPLSYLFYLFYFCWLSLSLILLTHIVTACHLRISLSVNFPSPTFLLSQPPSIFHPEYIVITCLYSLHVLETIRSLGPLLPLLICISLPIFNGWRPVNHPRIPTKPAKGIAKGAAARIIQGPTSLL